MRTVGVSVIVEGCVGTHVLVGEETGNFSVVVLQAARKIPNIKTNPALTPHILIELGPLTLDSRPTAENPRPGRFFLIPPHNSDRAKSGFQRLQTG
jgi:hypothetical protein